MFSRDIETKLPRVPTTTKGHHHERVRKRDREAKEKAKAHYDKKHRARQQEIKTGDKVYRRNRQPSTTKGPWEPQPHTVTEISHNLINGMRDRVDSNRDRGDWKKVNERPTHLMRTAATHVPAHRRLPTLDEDVFREGDLSEEEEDNPDQYKGPATRAAAKWRAAPTQPRQQPQPAPPAEGAEESTPAEEEDANRGPTAVGAEEARRAEREETNREPEGTARPPVEGPAPPQDDDIEYSPVDTYDDPRDKNLCRHCHTMVKMTTGRRTCTHYCTS